MRANASVCRLVVYLCATLAFLLIVTQPVLSLVLACLIPLWFFIDNVVVAPFVLARKIRKILSIPFLPVFAPRPPPAK